MTSKNGHLPQEIIHHIVSYLASEPRDLFDELPGPPSYSTISRDWQCAVEAVIYQSLKFEALDAEELIPSKLCSRRQSYVRDITLHCYPTPDLSPDFVQHNRPSHISVIRSLQNDALNGMLRLCFDMLSGWDNARPTGITLKLQMSLSQRHAQRNHERNYGWRRSPIADVKGELRDSQHMLNLDTSSGPLPVVKCVSKLKSGVLRMPISATTWATVLESLPNVTKLDFHLLDECDFSHRFAPQDRHLWERRRLREGTMLAFTSHSNR